jgi:peptidoglycan/xylan/chitin deacetylase (PgdA/CDA1 family)
MKAAFDDRDLKATVALNAQVCDDHPEIVEAIVESGWEILAHGYVQRVLNAEEDERDVIRRTADRIERASGMRPRGWLGPGLAETFDTLDILADEGYEYVADWCNDDQPYSLVVRSGTITSIPYTFELHDIAISLVQGHRSSELFDRARDQLEILMREGKTNARIMCIATHPYLTGVPHRIKYFEQLLDHLVAHDHLAFMSGSEILDWYKDEIAASRAR